MDFLNNAFRIGNDKTYIDWNASVANVLSMKNATVQIAKFRGTNDDLFQRRRWLWTACKRQYHMG